MIYPSVPVMGYKVYSNDLRDIRLDDGLVVINTLNAYSYVKAEEDPVFKKALQASDILVADGFPVVLAARWLGGYRINKIAGADVFLHVLGLLNSISGSCFFLGIFTEHAGEDQDTHSKGISSDLRFHLFTSIQGKIYYRGNTGNDHGCKQDKYHSGICGNDSTQTGKMGL